MKKDLLTHFTFTAAIFILVTLLKGWFDLVYLSFWIGGVIGTLLPDIDYLIHVYLLNPQSSDARTTAQLISQKKVTRTWEMVAHARNQNSELLFHTISFQLVFWVFAIFVITSTGSILAKGIVLAFSLHLTIDQATDLMERGNLNLWFEKAPFNLDQH